MPYRNRAFIVSFFIFQFLFGLFFHLFAATIVVDTNSPGGAVQGQCSLNAAIVSANLDLPVGGCASGSGADSIIFLPGIGPITLNTAVSNMGIGDSGLPAINSTITISGNPTIIETDITKYLRVFDVNETGALTLNNMTIRNGRGIGFGGGILVNEGELTLNHSTVSGNNVYAVTIPFTTSEVSMGGGIAAIGQASNIVINESNISGNTSEILGGGVMSEKNLLITDSLIENNSADETGGGIYASGTVTITDSIITSNTAELDGGGLYPDNAEVTVLYSTFNANKTTLGKGAAIYNAGLLIVTNSTFTTNQTLASSPGQEGAGIYNVALADLRNVTISNNYGKAAGVGIYNNNSGTLSLINCIIANSASAPPSGGFALIMDDVAGDAPYISMANIIEHGGAPWTASCSDCMINIDPGLKPLANNGGPTQTMALAKGSVAIDSGNISKCSDFSIEKDQRYFLRDDLCDIGSYEYNAGFGKMVPVMMYLLQ